jgi:hypothetical protein
MADVSQQVTLSLLTEFENHSILKPSHDNPTALDTLLDQVAARSSALPPLRTRVPPRRLKTRSPACRRRAPCRARMRLNNGASRLNATLACQGP